MAGVENDEAGKFVYFARRHGQQLLMSYKIHHVKIGAKASAGAKPYFTLKPRRAKKKEATTQQRRMLYLHTDILTTVSIERCLSNQIGKLALHTCF